MSLGLAALSAVVCLGGGPAALAAPAAPTAAECNRLTQAVDNFGVSPAARDALALFGGAPGRAVPHSAAALQTFHHSMAVLAGFAGQLKPDLNGVLASQDNQVVKTAVSLEHGSLAEVATFAASMKSDPRLVALAGSFQKAIVNLYTGCSSGSS